LGRELCLRYSESESDRFWDSDPGRRIGTIARPHLVRTSVKWVSGLGSRDGRERAPGDLRL